MEYINVIHLIMGLISIGIVILNYTVIPKDKRFGSCLAILNLSAGLFNLILAFTHF